MSRVLRPHHGMCFQFYEGKGYSEDGTCSTREKVEHYDKEVLKACGLSEGEEISFCKFTELVRERIIDAGIRSNICGDCSWDYICRGKEL